MKRHSTGLAGFAVLAATASAALAQAPAAPAPAAPAPIPLLAMRQSPAARGNLSTAAGLASVGTPWKSMEAKIIETPALPGALPAYKTTYDITPKAGTLGFDDSAWPVIEPDLSIRRGGGKVSFLWYRTTITVPAMVGNFSTAGAQAVLNIVVDDYAEVWVNGDLPRRPMFTSPGVVQGFNVPNKVVLSGAVKPGDKFEIAIFAMNGPISAAPANFAWVREANLEFYR